MVAADADVAVTVAAVAAEETVTGAVEADVMAEAAVRKGSAKKAVKEAESAAATETTSAAAKAAADSHPEALRATPLESRAGGTSDLRRRRARGQADS